MTEPPGDGGTQAPPTAPRPGAAAAESRLERLNRHAQRVRLYLWSFVLAAMLVCLVALVLANTRQVKLSWVFGSTHSSLVWIILVAALLGWLAGIATSILQRRRTRRMR
jgi:uncharacterized integral membrane protein